MKVKIKNLKPNPFRQIGSYPVNEQKVNVLMDSIKQTGFWDNILARQVNGEIQIAYGHHRLEALKRLMDPEDEVDIPVKDLNDETMIKIMANENMDDWATTPGVIDQTIKATREFLLANPEIAQKYGQLHKSLATDEHFVGAILIARFLGWTQQRVSDSLERLKLVNSGMFTQLTIDMFETEGSARTFVQKIKENEEAGNPIPIEKHEEIVQKFKESGNSPKVMDEVIEEVVKTAPKGPYNPTKRLEAKLSHIIDAIDQFEECMKAINFIYDKKTGIPASWDDIENYSTLIDKLNSISADIQAFMNSHEKCVIINP